jgi:hypothetical protein
MYLSSISFKSANSCFTSRKFTMLFFETKNENSKTSGLVKQNSSISGMKKSPKSLISFNPPYMKKE